MTTNADVGDVFLESARFRFRSLRKMGDATLAQLSDDDLVWRANEETNSIAVIVQHFNGNMLSRWIDFLTTDGDKPTRDRDSEFVEPAAMTKVACEKLWNEGWDCLENAIGSMGASDVCVEVTIRRKQLTLIDALNRQLVHVAYHVGQMVQIAKERLGTDWKTMSIPRGQSKLYKPGGRD